MEGDVHGFVAGLGGGWHFDDSRSSFGFGEDPAFAAAPVIAATETAGGNAFSAKRSEYCLAQVYFVFHVIG